MTDNKISNDDNMLRRVRPVHVVSDPKAPAGRRASSAAFDDARDGSSMSVYIRSVVYELGLIESAVVIGKPPGWAAASTPVNVLNEEEQVVKADPIVDAAEPHPCDPAHALVHGDKRSKARRDRIAKRSPLVYIIY